MTTPSEIECEHATGTEFAVFVAINLLPPCEDRRIVAEAAAHA
jgi:hypothetical protein